MATNHGHEMCQPAVAYIKIMFKQLKVQPITILTYKRAMFPPYAHLI